MKRKRIRLEALERIRDDVAEMIEKVDLLIVDKHAFTRLADAISELKVYWTEEYEQERKKANTKLVKQVSPNKGKQVK